jgi:adenosylhomocysteinase
MNAALKPLPTDAYAIATSRSPSGAARKSASPESEMPALMAIREEYAATQPLKGAACRQPPHDDPDRRAVETLQALGADGALGLVQHLLDAGPRRRRARVEGTPVFAYKGESLRDYWDYTHRIFEFGAKGARAKART